MTVQVHKVHNKAMKTVNTAHIHFGSDFHGQLHLKEGEIKIGSEDREARPYDLLLGALAACLHHTFLEIVQKKRLRIESVEYHITGTKREEIPTTLEEVVIEVVMPHHEKEAQLEKSFKLATEYCSIFETIRQVAQMHVHIRFV